MAVNWKKFEKELKTHPMAEIAPMYIYATEMVSDYYQKLKIRNKKILTICGSGDQVLDAMALGAKKVVGFDLNKWSEYIARLKIAAIKKLNYKEFLTFFGDTEKAPSFSYNLYKKLRTALKPSIKKFFDGLYSKYTFSGRRLVKSSYFRQREHMKLKIQEVNVYLKNETSYLRLGKILSKKDFVFINSGVDKISKKTNKKFDIVNLSNVPTYFVGGLLRAGKEDAIERISSVFSSLKKLVSKNGKIFYYFYTPKLYLDKPAGIPSARSKLDFLAKNGNFNIKFVRIRSIIPGARDRINILS